MTDSLARLQPALVASLLAFGSFRGAHAQAWVPLPSPGPGLTAQVDTASVSTVGSNTFGSFRWTGLVDGDTTEHGVKFAYLEYSVVVNCRAGRLAFEARSYYAPADTIIDGIFWPEDEWQFIDVSRGTIGSVQRDVLCAAAKQRSDAGLPATRTTSRAFVTRPATIASNARSLDIAPTLAGFRLGQPLRIARPLVGLPLKVDTLGTGSDSILSFQNSSTGITLLATWTDGVGAILSTRRDAGAVNGVRVGDRRSDVLSRWGPPAATSADAATWIAGPWMITASFDSSGQIVRLGIGQ